MTTSLHAEALANYLNDHVAGSVAAVELMDNLLGSAPGPEAEALLGKWRAAVDQEQRMLRALVDAVGSENKVSQAVAWVGEKVARLKIGALGDGSPLRRFEALEALGIGFNGKRLLWITLARLQDDGILRSDLDFAALARTAAGQMEELEKIRLEAAHEALTLSPAA